MVSKALTEKTRECLAWPWAKNKAGYAVCYNPGSSSLGNRLACELAHGPPPTPRHYAAHSCHNTSCVNPNHLRWATSKENNADKVDNGTSNRGARCGASKLTDEQVIKIRVLYATRQASQYELSKLFGVSQQVISNITSGVSWADTGGPITKEPKGSRSKKGSRHHSSKLTEDQICEIRIAYRLRQVTQKSLAKSYGVSKSTISLIVRGKIWGHVSEQPTDQVRGARYRGSAHQGSKLTEEIVREIRRRYETHPRPTLKELGLEFGVTTSVVSEIVNRKAWKHVL